MLKTQTEYSAHNTLYFVKHASQTELKLLTEQLKERLFALTFFLFAGAKCSLLTVRETKDQKGMKYETLAASGGGSRGGFWTTAGYKTAKESTKPPPCDSRALISRPIYM